MVGEQLGSYLIEGTLGVGAMGVVYKAKHVPSNRDAAVKVVNGEVANRGKTHERFEREAKILQQFRHPNIVRFFALGRYKGTSYFAMEFIKGMTLDQYLQKTGLLGWKEVAGYAEQVCDALHYAHEHGVVHRDLKPSNLMVTEEGQIKLTDFGIAKDLDATALTATGRTLGTAAYMAPEQIRGTPEISHKTDLYALGVVMYQMLTGQLPFEGSSAMVLMHAHINAPVPRASSKIVEIPRALDDLILQLMAKSPSGRPWDAAAAGESLKQILAKADRGEPVAMVWPGEADADAGTPAGGGSTTRAVAEGVKKIKSVKKKAAAADPDEKRARNRFLLESAGLVLLLAAMAGFVYYMLRPQSEEYLFTRAEKLMASTRRGDWVTALEEYVDELDRRFPDGPHRDQTHAWRDKIALYDTDQRAGTLSRAVNSKLGDPQTPNETRFLEFNTLVTAARRVSDDGKKLCDDRRAAALWDEMASQLKPDDGDDRPWYLYAKAQADKLRRDVEQRRESVSKLLERELQSRIAGQAQEAQSLHDEILAKYGRFADVAEFLPPPPPAVAPAEPVPAATLRTEGAPR